MLKAVVFDMDGVLIDSEPVHFAANKRMMREQFGIELVYEDYRGFIGSTVEKIWKFYREKYKLYQYEWNQLMDMAESVLAQMVEKDGYPEIKGAVKMVRSLKEKGHLLALASSSPMTSILRNLKSLGITECFDTIVSGMEVENPKPAPDIFLQAAGNLRVKPDECIVIEDSCNGAKAAKAAGMACLGFINPNSGNQDLSEADYLFEDFLNIDEAFVRMVHNHCFNIPWKVMETDRLIIREMWADDIDHIIRVYEPEEITEYMEPLYPREQEIAYMKDYISNIYMFYGYGMWIVETKEGRVIGKAGIEYLEKINPDETEIVGKLRFQKEGAENNYEEDKGFHVLGYVIDRDYQHKGYGYEACSGILEYAKDELGINTVYVKVHKDNKKSICLGEKLGFVF